MAGQLPDRTSTNNMIVNNVSTHEGGGIAHRRRPERADRQQHDHEEPDHRHRRHLRRPAGPGRAVHRREQRPLQATLPAGSPTFSNPLLFNNIFWDNRAGTRGRHTVIGIGGDGDATPINQWDLGAADGSGTLAADELGRPAERRRRHPYTDEPDQHRRRTRPCVDPLRRLGRRSPRGGRTRTSSARSSSASDLPPNLLGNYHLADRRRRPSTPARRARPSRPTSSRRRPSRPRRPTSTASHGRLAAASTSGRTRSRRRSPTCRSRRPTA